MSSPSDHLVLQKDLRCATCKEPASHWMRCKKCKGIVARCGGHAQTIVADRENHCT